MEPEKDYSHFSSDIEHEYFNKDVTRYGKNYAVAGPKTYLFGFENKMYQIY